MTTDTQPLQTANNHRRPLWPAPANDTNQPEYCPRPKSAGLGSRCLPCATATNCGSITKQTRARCSSPGRKRSPWAAAWITNIRTFTGWALVTIERGGYDTRVGSCAKPTVSMICKIARKFCSTSTPGTCWSSAAGRRMGKRCTCFISRPDLMLSQTQACPMGCWRITYQLGNLSCWSRMRRRYIGMQTIPKALVYVFDPDSDGQLTLTAGDLGSNPTTR